MKAALLFLAAFAMVTVGSCSHMETAPARDVLVTIEQGQLRGVASEGVESFFNIPFAAAPVGPLRWRAPMAAPSWRGVREAAQFGPSCPQPVRPAIVAGGIAAQQSEDCLQLNVWRPHGAERTPVMVWLHGGAHVIGSGTFPAFNGAELARDGVIVVTINYRLGALGYFAHPALTSEAARSEAPTGNFGLMDQLAALRWIKNNIGAFGGDPERITVFGESAGAIDIVTLLANPEARGLFSAAIVQSGINLFEPNSLERQETLGRAIAVRAGLDEDANIDALRSLSVETVLAASAGSGAGLVNPFVDGRLVVEAPWRAFAEDRAVAVPLLIGSNSDEASVIFAMGVSPQSVLALPGAEQAARDRYGLAVTDGEFARQAMGDLWFVGPARWVAAHASRRAPVYLYHFDYVLSARRDDARGAPHGSDVPFVFQTLDYVASLGGAVSSEDRTFARGLSSCWSEFARSHRPACTLVSDWPAYSEASDTAVLLTAQPRLVSQFRESQLDWALSQAAHGAASRQGPTSN